MKLIFSSSALLGAFNALTAAARSYVPPQPLSSKPSTRSVRPPGPEAPLRIMNAAVGIVQLLDAAVRFTVQLAVTVAERDQDKARRTLDLVAAQQGSSSSAQRRPLPALESELIAKLSTWDDKEGTLALRLSTHDIDCVIGELGRAARRYASPQQDTSLMHVVEILPRNLTVAAVAFTIQLAIEETERSVDEMRSLEAQLIAELEEPWDPFKVPLSVDVQEGPSWGSLPEDG